MLRGAFKSADDDEKNGSFVMMDRYAGPCQRQAVYHIGCRAVYGWRINRKQAPECMSKGIPEPGYILETSQSGKGSVWWK